MSLTQRVRNLEKQAGNLDGGGCAIVGIEGKTEEEIQAEVDRLLANNPRRVVLVSDGNPGPFRKGADNGLDATD
jgi:hypothetical protein